MSRNGYALASIVALHAFAPDMASAQAAGTAQEPAAQPTPAPAAQPAPEPAAQPAPEPATQRTPEPAPEAQGGRVSFGEQVVVTGSRIQRKELAAAAPVAVITSEQIQASGKLTVGDFLQTLPAQGNAANTLVNNGGDGRTEVNLRSLGARRTLVLVNGKRFISGVPGGGNLGDPGVDLNSIPLGAVERIEVLKDGASAVYGSDAIGGVVNIITRRRATGVQANATHQFSEHGDAQVTDVSLLAGASGEKGSFQLGAGYYKQESMLAANRDWAKYALNYNYATGAVTPGGSAAIPQGFVGLDPATCSTTLCQQLVARYGAGRKNWIPDPSTAEGWRPYTSADAYNFQAVNYLVTPSERISLYASGDYNLGANARAYFHSTFVNRYSSNLLAPEPLSAARFGVVVSANSQYNPFGVDLSNVLRRVVESGGRSRIVDVDTFQFIAGVDGTLPSALGPLAGWFYDLSLNYARNSNKVTTHGSLNTQRVGQALGPSQNGVCYTSWNATTGYSGPIAGCTPVNLFGLAAGQPMTPDMLASLGLVTGVNSGFNQMLMAEFNTSGDLFKLMSERPAALALGYAFRRETGYFTYNPLAVAQLDSDYNGFNTQGSFTVNEGYGELVVPVVSGREGVEDLELSAALRYSNYDTFGSTTTYKFGGRYTPIRDATLRGTFSTGFRAPGITSLYGGTGPNAESARDPCAGPGISSTSPLGVQCQQALTRGGGGLTALNTNDPATQINSTSGGNPDLQPEKADIWTAGVVFEPAFARNLTVTVDYFNVTITRNVDFYTTGVILSGCYPGSTGTPNPAFCDLIKRNTTTGLITDVTDILRNVGETRTQGLDVAFRYGYPTPVGRFSLSGEATVVFQYDKTLPNGIVDKILGTYDQGLVMPDYKFNLGLAYEHSGFSGALIGRFVGSYKECADSRGANSSAGLCYLNNLQTNGTPYPAHTIPFYQVYDLHLAYVYRWEGMRTSIGLGVRNLFNVDPPFVYNQQTSIGTDPSAYDLVGRAFYVQLGHKF